MKYFIDEVEVSQEVYKQKLWGEIYRSISDAAAQTIDDYEQLLPF
jgi:hypothetical protein